MIKNPLWKIAAAILLIRSGNFGIHAQEAPKVARALPAAGPNDIARFLAGIPVPPDSPLAPLMRDPVWQSMWVNRPPIKDGMMQVSTGLGFGLELDPKMIAKYRVG